MSDILSAASLMLTVLGVLYGLWYNDIEANLSLPITKTFRSDLGNERRQIQTCMRQKAGPLLVATLGTFLVFLPDLLAVVLHSVARFQTDPVAALKSYDAIRTAFCFVSILTFGIALYVIAAYLGLRRKLRAIDKKAWSATSQDPPSA